MEGRIVRFISVYRKSSDSVAGRYLLRGVPKGFLQSLFGEASSNPMYDVYPIDHARLAALRRFVSPGYELVKRPLDLARYDYFLEAEVEVEEKSSASRDYIDYYGKTYARKQRRPVIEADGTRKLIKKS